MNIAKIAKTLLSAVNNSQTILAGSLREQLTGEELSEAFSRGWLIVDPNFPSSARVTYFANAIQELRQLAQFEALNKDQEAAVGKLRAQQGSDDYEVTGDVVTIKDKSGKKTRFKLDTTGKVDPLTQ